MSGKQGFSLLEILIVIIIIGIAVSVLLPNLNNAIEQTKAQAAKNNLLAIVAAQQRYYEDYNAYYPEAATQAACTTSVPSAAAAFTAALQQNLRLGSTISNSDPFYYCCYTSGSFYGCLAKDSTLTLTDTTTALGISGSISCAPSGPSCPN